MNKCKQRNKKKKFICTVRFTTEEDKRLRALAKIKGQTISQVVREGLRPLLLGDDKNGKEIFGYIYAAMEIIDADEDQKRRSCHGDDT